jgi:hypothetical protein
LIGKPPGRDFLGDEHGLETFHLNEKKEGMQYEGVDSLTAQQDLVELLAFAYTVTKVLFP